MPKLRRVSGAEAIRALERLGFKQVRQKGSHVVLKKGEQGCVVPLHEARPRHAAGHPAAGRRDAGRVRRRPEIIPFREILEGRRAFGRLDQDWAARRLREYAPYAEIIRLIGFPKLIKNWPRWRGRIRSRSRQRGFDFLVQWLPEKHPEYCRE